ncbi:MAG: 5-oxoprolinase subunit PxpB [Acidobacteria bacterium]|nr:MAG: 5-oxoprolinase subunit PxpB [Acidobacteriota bacterium]
MRIVDAGDACLILEFESRVDPEINDACVAIADRLGRLSVAGVRDVVATYHTVAVHIDPLQVDRTSLVGQLEQLAASATDARPARGASHEIPVCYGDEFGPDLTDVAQFGECTEDEVVRLHSAPTYRVYMMGFLPGFAYLGSVPERIRMGRLDTPRLRVQTGSVAIAGLQTGIYPLEAPGGWRIIGRTWIKPFDPERQQPWMFQAGDAVRFVPVSRAVFLGAMAGEPNRAPR